MPLSDRQELEPHPGTPRAMPLRRVPVPYLSYAIMAVSAAMFFYLDERLAPLLPADQQALPPGTLFGPRVRAGEWWRALTFALEHGGVLHLVLNMSVVWTLGVTLERALRTWRFALVSLATCLGSAAFALYFNFDVPTVGASGMILGWAGAMLPLATATGRRELLTWLVQVAVISFLPGVSWAGHLGGFLFGLPCGAALRLGGGARFALLGPLLVILSAGAVVGAVVLQGTPS